MVSVAIPPGAILPDAPYWIDTPSGDVWMALPDGRFVMVDYRYGRVTWVSQDPATLEGIRTAGYKLDRPVTYAEAMITLLLRVINRFESSLRAANLL